MRPMHFTVVSSIALCVVACSSQATQSDAGTGTTTGSCAARSGIYNFNESLLSGNCGPAINPTSFNVAEGSQTFAIPYILAERAGAGSTTRVADAFPACTGSVTVSQNNCTLEYDYTCPLPGGTNKLKTTGSTTWAREGTSAKGEAASNIFDANGSSLCSGKYGYAISK